MNNKVLAEKVLAVSKSLKIRLDRNPCNFYHNRTKPLFTSPGIDSEEKKIVFRVGLSELDNLSITREVEIYQKSLQLKLNYFPELIDFGEFDGNKWLTYKYINGNTAGNTYFFEPGVEYDQIFDFLAGMKNLGEFLPKNLFRVSTKKKYQGEISTIIKKNHLLAQKLEKQIEKINNGAKDWNQNFLTHGDLHPQNIFINDQGIKVIDWESVHYNLMPFDYSFVWIRCYNQKVRDRIMSILFHEKVDEKQIYFVFSVNLLRDLFEWYQIKTGKNDFVKISGDINESLIKNTIDNLQKNLEYFTSKL